MPGRTMITLFFLLFLFILSCTSPEISSQPCHQMSDGVWMGDCTGHQEELVVAPAEGNSLEAADVNVVFSAEGATTDSPTTLTFALRRRNSAAPLDSLEIVHEKPLHLILVRDDLNYFAHLHPEENEIQKGQFRVSHLFWAPGNYRLWLEFHKGKQYLIDFPLRIEGEKRSEKSEPLSDENRADEKVVVTLDASPTLVPGPALLQFKVQDRQGKALPITERFLGASAHLISIDETLGEFAHGHDLNFDKDNSLSFTQQFSQPGRYKLWVQFRAEGNDQIKEFTLEVVENAALTEH